MAYIWAIAYNPSMLYILGREEIPTDYDTTSRDCLPSTGRWGEVKVLFHGEPENSRTVDLKKYTAAERIIWPWKQQGSTGHSTEWSFPARGWLVTSVLCPPPGPWDRSWQSTVIGNSLESEPLRLSQGSLLAVRRGPHHQVPRVDEEKTSRVDTSGWR